MKTIRSNIFETNSSSTHSLVFKPVDIDLVFKSSKDPNLRLVQENYHEAIPFCPKKKMLVLNNHPGFEFATYYGFYEKLNYVMCMKFIPLLDEYGSKQRKYDDYDTKKFTVRNGNRMIEDHFSEFSARIAKHVSEVYGVDCRKIGYLPGTDSDEPKLTCHFSFDHEVLYSAHEDPEQLGLNTDPYDVIVTDGIGIYYRFS